MPRFYFSQIDWEHLFYLESPPSVKPYWNKSTQVNVGDPHYIERMGDLIKKTNKTTLINYGVFKAVHTLAKLLDSRYDDVRLVNA